MKISNYLIEQFQFSSELAENIDSMFAVQELPKGTQLLEMNRHTDKIIYIEKGLARLYYIKEGKDITAHFFPEKLIFLSVKSIFFNQPNKFAMELLENSVVRTLNYSTIEPLLKSNPELQMVMSRLLIDVVHRTEDFLFSYKFQTPEERYASLMKRHPDLILRAPLGHIASLLGMTQATLSRVRGKK